uniref:Uncharacterized protein n=1 Tax=Tanacetum cinerariifolium TaxID=118510 RepID=A0A699HNT3_TANCI|nr:hypothetical protein [Tanacetum cinerariifolium]
MASRLTKVAAFNLLRVGPVSSSSRFFNTKAFKYVQNNSEDDCILKGGRKHPTLVRGAVNYAYSPRLSPIGNLASLLNLVDDLVGFKDTPEMLIPRWTVAEDDKALYILRNMIGQHLKESVPMMEYVPMVNSVPLMEYVKKVNSVPMNESAPKTEPDPVMEYGSKVESVQMMESAPKMETVRKREYLGREIPRLMRGVKSTPSEYYCHVMQDPEEVKSFFGSFIGSELTAIGAEVNVPRVLNDPQALYLIVGLMPLDARDVYGGYAYEIFLQDTLYNLWDVEMDFTSEGWKITIPKVKGKWTQTIEGNLIFYREKKIWKPTLWRPK